MFPSRMTAGDARSWVWVLLILPVGLGAGWLIGQMPTPPAPPDPAALVANAEPVAHAGGSPVAAAERSPAPRPELSDWTGYSSALDESRRTGKPILLDFNAAWCPPCRRMQREVFDDGPRGRAVRAAVIPVAVVDRRREDGANPSEVDDLQRRHQIDAFPTLVVFSPATGRRVSTRGYGGPQATLAWITEAANRVR